MNTNKMESIKTKANELKLRPFTPSSQETGHTYTTDARVCTVHKSNKNQKNDRFEQRNRTV